MSVKSAVIVESSDDGGLTWGTHGIYWSAFEAAAKAREIPWEWRLRRVKVSEGDIFSTEEVESSLAEAERIERVLGEVFG